MSITIAADMYLLCSLFNISYKKIANDYQGMTVEQIMEAEAAQGNTSAANFDKTVLTDPVKLIELFRLKDPGNKYAILHNMNECDLEELLPLLEQSDLVFGLNFFNKDKLLSMAEELPKEQLIKLTGQMFSQEQIMQYLPEEQLDKMLMSTDMDKQQEIKYLKSIKPEVLALMLESATGQPVAGAENAELSAQTNLGSQASMAAAGSGQTNLDSQAMLNQIVNLPDDRFQEAMLAMPKQNKRDFLLKLAKENPKLYLAVDAHAYTDMINQRKDKGDIIKSANVIPHEQLVKMIAKLPKDLMSVVLTQIDTKKFADELLSKFKNIISQIIAG